VDLIFILPVLNIEQGKFLNSNIIIIGGVSFVLQIGIPDEVITLIGDRSRAKKIGSLDTQARMCGFCLRASE